jgi:hypothetical protein
VGQSSLLGERRFFGHVLKRPTRLFGHPTKPLIENDVTTANAAGAKTVMIDFELIFEAQARNRRTRKDKVLLIDVKTILDTL